MLNLNQPDANELVGDVFDVFQTNNLSVKVLAIASGDTSKDDHHRLFGMDGGPFCSFVVELPTVGNCLTILFESAPPSAAASTLSANIG